MMPLQSTHNKPTSFTYAVHASAQGDSICAESNECVWSLDIEYARTDREGGHGKHLRAYCGECDSFLLVHAADGDNYVPTDTYYKDAQ